MVRTSSKYLDSISTYLSEFTLLLISLFCFLHLSDSVAVTYAQPQSNPQTQQTNDSALMAGQTVERELKAGEGHSYRITLASGQYLHIVVEQIGINVEVAIANPKGEKLASLDWWWREGAESLWVLAESSGDYTLKVDASNKPDEMGKYRIKVEKIGDWQQASDTDRNYVNAYRNFAMGEKLLAQGTAESQHAAIEKYQEALKLWRTLKDADAEAQALNALGTIYYQSGNYKEGEEYISQAIPLFQKSGNHGGEADSRNTLGNIYNLSGQTQRAFDSYNQVLPLVR
ncbi:MAG: tetratricopeptide repeat protein, partial [Acidobacteriota bacterium]|nr:tetratricopeptide repeat protein [Acidobacteriota bacterium]